VNGEDDAVANQEHSWASERTSGAIKLSAIIDDYSVVGMLIVGVNEDGKDQYYWPQVSL
jgi:hypothetical protein